LSSPEDDKARRLMIAGAAMPAPMAVVACRKRRRLMAGVAPIRVLLVSVMVVSIPDDAPADHLCRSLASIAGYWQMSAVVEPTS
jgi:hypothetical protein